MKFFKRILATTVCLGILFSFASLTNAASSDTWDIDYSPGVPPAYSNQADTTTLSYYSGGYVAHCSSISGGQGRRVSVTSSSCGGITGTDVVITTTGNTRRFKLRYSTTGNIHITFTAESFISCDANGTVHI